MALEDLLFGLQKIFTHIWPSIHRAVISDVPRRYWTMDGLPEKAGNFSPFFGDEGTEQVWSRDADLKRFMLQMESNIYTHTILTGPSGSGKSTFLRRVVKPVLGKNLKFNNSYLDFTKTFIDIIPTPDHLVPRKLELEEAIAAFLQQPIKLSINKVLQDNTLFKIPKVLVDIGDTAEAFIRDALKDQPRTFFVFDQIERFLSDLKHLQYQPEEAARTLSVYIVIRVFKTLRQLENTRTIFRHSRRLPVRFDRLLDLFAGQAGRCGRHIPVFLLQRHQCQFVRRMRSSSRLGLSTRPSVLLPHGPTS